MFYSSLLVFISFFAFTNLLFLLGSTRSMFGMVILLIFEFWSFLTDLIFLFELGTLF